jgi:putative holliday junction resolvase
MSSNGKEVLALDIGAARIGVARVNTVARIPEPLAVIKNDEYFTSNLAKIIADNGSELVVVGLPRNMSGQTTKQTDYVVSFIGKYLSQISIPIVYQDETLSSVVADGLLTKSTINMQDAVAAAVILDYYLKEN